MVLGKLLEPGRPTNLDSSWTMAYYGCSRCGWWMFGHLFSHLSFLTSFSLSLGDGPIWTAILSQRAVKRKTKADINTFSAYGIKYKQPISAFYIYIGSASYITII